MTVYTIFTFLVWKNVHLKKKSSLLAFIFYSPLLLFVHSSTSSAFGFCSSVTLDMSMCLFIYVPNYLDYIFSPLLILEKEQCNNTSVKRERVHILRWFYFHPLPTRKKGLGDNSDSSGISVDVFWGGHHEENDEKPQVSNNKHAYWIQYGWLAGDVTSAEKTAFYLDITKTVSCFAQGYLTIIMAQPSGPVTA